MAFEKFWRELYLTREMDEKGIVYRMVYKERMFAENFTTIEMDDFQDLINYVQAIPHRKRIYYHFKGYEKKSLEYILNNEQTRR